MYCPKCLLEGNKAELVENALLKRCVKCSFDYKSEVRENTVVNKPIRGLNSILGAAR